MTSTVRLHFASRLRQRREILKLSQQQLAQQLGIPVPELDDYENGRQRVSAILLLKFAERLKVSLRYFFGDNSGNGGEARQSGFEEGAAVAGSYAEAIEIVRLVSAFDAISEAESRMSVIDLAEALAHGQLN